MPGVLTVIACACGEFGPTLCTTSVEPAIEIEVRDAVTAEPIAGEVGGLIRDGSFEDSLRVSRLDGQGRPVSLRAGDERPGVYAVLLRSEAYEDWDTAGVQVNRGECHVRTAMIQAELHAVP